MKLTVCKNHADYSIVSRRQVTGLCQQEVQYMVKLTKILIHSLRSLSIWVFDSHKCQCFSVCVFKAQIIICIHLTLFSMSSIFTNYIEMIYYNIYTTVTI